jgi:hypothetical protein
VAIPIHRAATRHEERRRHDRRSEGAELRGAGAHVRPVEGSAVTVIVDARRLRRELARRGLSASQLAREAGLSTPTITAALGGRAISATSLRLIAQALTRLPALDVIDSLLLAEPEPPDLA